MDLLTLAIGVLFALVFVWALAAWWRERDPLGRDVVLVFSAMAAVFVLSVLEVAIGTPPPLVAWLAVGLLLAQPFFTLRLAARVHPVPRVALLAAAAGWLATALPLAVLGSAVPTPVILATAAVFVVTEAAAAAYLAVAASRRAGAGAVRLWVAAIATGLFAFAILAAGSGAAVSGAGEAANALARVAALLAALGYLAAFVPPRGLRRAWQAQTAYAGLQSLLELRDDDDDAWHRFLSIARDATGAAMALVVEAPSPGERRIAAVSGLPVELVGSPVEATAALRDDEVPIEAVAATGGLRAAAAAARASGARIAHVIVLGREPAATTLVLFSTHRSLFAEDDRRLLAALGQQAAGLGERSRLAEQLAATVEALRSASQAKSDFLASMSHELRTPLNAILGFSDLMRREEPRPGGTVEIPIEWVEHIHRGGVHLVELVNDVLDLSKVEAGRLDLDRERIEVLPAVAEAVAGLRPLAERKHHAIEVDVEPDDAVDADRGRLRQILYNLLSNAIKFTPDGGRITIQGRVEGDEYRLAVVDTGIGIAAGDLAGVFEEFRQVGHGAQRTEGTGLGLALTRRLVEAHQGRMELESTPGVGSRFTAVLPTAGPRSRGDGHEAAIEAPATPGRATGRRSVLIVEDDPSAVGLLRAYLEPEGYEVRVVPDGEHAVEAARSQAPVAILLDVLLPGIDGWEVLRRLKADAALRDIPVVIVTVVDEKEVGLALGAYDYLVKPIDRDALLTTLGRLAQASDGPARSLRILVVDDEPATLDLLEETLGPAGFEVMRAAGGRSGVEAARRIRPDLVICDLVMPDLDGFGVVGALKADPLTAEVPIIILTGHDLSPADKRRLNGKVLGIVAKGPAARTGLRAWLARAGASAAL